VPVSERPARSLGFDWHDTDRSDHVRTISA
jgi:hypothetical protein